MTMAGKECERENMGRTGLEIAVIGMAGRFPGAQNLHEFWQNLIEARESVSTFSDQELEEIGADSELIDNPNYVRTAANLERIEYFDAAFFGFTPREAELLHPQTRMLMKCVWETLEDAGYDPETYDGLIGLYAGCTSSFNWEALSQLVDSGNSLENNIMMHLTDKDFSCSQISYNLNLKGACSAVHTACSTSLLAVHLACRALLTGESDMVLAGGACVYTHPQVGYFYREGMILSPDGHCRAFDARSRGTIPGSGAGVVLLKRLKAALADRDHIYAVIKGSAINNDGRRKVGYRAPSIEGQADVIRAAQRMARIEPESITYIETHGTGTILGDPVEIAGLKLAFNTVDSTKKNLCAIGSVKTNIGHLDSAAGCAGFIKTVLALKHRFIPPSLNFEIPNPKIDIENSPFYVNTRLKKWESRDYPLRAGVSSFGAGGTNVHVILEQAPEPQQSPASRCWQLLPFSAKTPTALEKMTGNFAACLKQNPGTNLSDAAYTLQVGRAPFQYRKVVVCQTTGEAIDILSSPATQKVNRAKIAKITHDHKPVVFMFPGLGAQYVNMGLELYREEPIFREAMNRCFDILKSLSDYDIKEILYPSPLEDSQSARITHDIEIAQLVVFCLEYALAVLLIKLGIKPYAMIGYSFGEYTAACISGVFSLEQALKLIAARGQLLAGLPAGAMISVPLSRKQLIPFLAGELSLAVDNGESCVISGPLERIEVFQRDMQEKRVMCTPLPGTRALHSRMTAPIKEKLEPIAGRITLDKPGIPYISNVTGDWIKIHEARDPQYWSDHMQQTVQFAAGLKQLVKEPDVIFLEIGPGRDLCSLISRYLGKNAHQQALNLIRSANEDFSDGYYFFNRIGQLWRYGVNIDWKGLYREENRYRISLPAYPFEEQYYWIKGDLKEIGKNLETKNPLLDKKPDIADWFYVPSWTRSMSILADSPEPALSPSSTVLVFTGENRLALQLVEALKQFDHPVITVKKGLSFNQAGEKEYMVNPRQRHDYELLFAELDRQGMLPDHIIHLWCLTGTGGNGLPQAPDYDFNTAQEMGFYSLVYLVKAMGKVKYKYTAAIKIDVVSTFLQSVIGQEFLCPEKSTVLGPLKVIPQEYPYITCRATDIDVPAPGSLQEKQLIWQLLKEHSIEPVDTMVAFRNNYRWVQTVQPVRFQRNDNPLPPLKKHGVYLVTGGLGNIGFLLAEYLAKTVQARLILTGRTLLPPRHEWKQGQEGVEAQVKKVHGSDRPETSLKDKIEKIRQLERLGAVVLYESATVTDLKQMKALVCRAEQQMGQINGLIHAAGSTDPSLFQSIEEITERECQAHFLPKVDGVRVLDGIFRERDLDFCLLVSSLAPILGGLGFVAYSAANLFLDTFVQQRHQQNASTGTGTCRCKWTAVNWGDWQTGKLRTAPSTPGFGASALALAMTPAQGIETFKRILNHPGIQQVVVSAGDLQTRIDQWVKLQSLRDSGQKTADEPATLQARPDIISQFVPPRNPMEHDIAVIWQNFFGFEPVGIQDNFFELGGDSLKAITIISAIQKKLNTVIPLVEFFNHPTIEKLVQYFTKEETPISLHFDELDEQVVFLKKSNRKTRHVFFLHDGTGDVDVYMELCRQMNTGFNYWGIRAQRLHNYTPCNFVIEQGVREYIRKIKKIQPQGPYYLSGWSYGGIIAFEIVRQLEIMKEPIRFFAMIDPVTPVKNSVSEFHPFTLESELKGLEVFPEGTIRDIRKKVENSTISELPQLWPLVVEYLEENHFDVEIIKKTIPANMARAIPDFHGADIRKSIYYINAIRSFSRSLAFYTIKNKINSKVHYFGAHQSRDSKEFNRASWDNYCIKPMYFYEIPGDHFTILKLPEVTELAKIFDRQLQVLIKDNKNCCAPADR